MKSIIRNSLKEAEVVLSEFADNPRNIDAINNAANIMAQAIANGNKIVACGNGGSLCDATHFAEELTARFRENRKGLPAIAVNDPAFITCALNDFSPTSIFARYVEAVAVKGDVLLAISTSGNSRNIIEAASAAKKIGLNVIALTGKDGGELANLADVEIRAPKTKFSDRAQEIHIKVIHIFVECIEEKIFK